MPSSGVRLGRAKDVDYQNFILEFMQYYGFTVAPV